MRHARTVFTSNRRQWLDFFPSFPSCRYTPISIETRHLFKYPPPFKFNTRLIKIFLEKRKKGIVRSSFFLHFSCLPPLFFPLDSWKRGQYFLYPKTVSRRRHDRRESSWIEKILVQDRWKRSTIKSMRSIERRIGGGSCFIKTAQLVPFSGILLFTYRLTERLISSSRLSRTCASKRTNFSH